MLRAVIIHQFVYWFRHQVVSNLSSVFKSPNGNGRGKNQ
jgi:hypothetical protein